MRRLLRPLAFATLLGAATGCYGQFHLTKTIHQWNGQVTDNRFVHTLVFWRLVIVPIYELMALGDAFVFNVIEFWTGDNILADASSPRRPKVTAMADGSAVFETRNHRYRLYPKGDRALQIWVDGELAGYMEKREDGGFALLDHRSGSSITLAGTQVERLQAAL